VNREQSVNNPDQTPINPAVMKTRTVLSLLVSHSLVAVVGFAAGIYALPILIAPAAPTAAELKSAAAQAMFTGQFKRDLKDSDALHWGEGVVSVAARTISLAGKLSPGPDYRLYLSPEFVETEADFKRLKSRMVQVGSIKTFENFVVQVPAGIEPANYSAVIIWCETFSEFITAAKYR
jgi:Electron transfer DM13